MVKKDLLKKQLVNHNQDHNQAWKCLKLKIFRLLNKNKKDYFLKLIRIFSKRKPLKTWDSKVFWNKWLINNNLTNNQMSQWDSKV